MVCPGTATLTTALYRAMHLGDLLLQSRLRSIWHLDPPPPRNLCATIACWVGWPGVLPIYYVLLFHGNLHPVA